MLAAWFPRVNEILIAIGSHNLLATPSRAMLDDARLRPLIDEFLHGANGVDAERRAALYRLAWDFVGSDLGARNELYERNYLASARTNRIGAYMIYSDRTRPHALVDAILGGRRARRADVLSARRARRRRPRRCSARPATTPPSRRSRSPGRRPRWRTPYRISQLVAEAKLQAGAILKGHKIGLTSRPMQEAAGINEPDYGVLLDDCSWPRARSSRPTGCSSPSPRPSWPSCSGSRWPARRSTRPT